MSDDYEITVLIKDNRTAGMELNAFNCNELANMLSAVALLAGAYDTLDDVARVTHEACEAVREETDVNWNIIKGNQDDARHAPMN